jgi:hypothetical protein
MKLSGGTPSDGIHTRTLPGNGLQGTPIEGRVSPGQSDWI